MGAARDRPRAGPYLRREHIRPGPEHARLHGAADRIWRSRRASRPRGPDSSRRLQRPLPPRHRLLGLGDLAPRDRARGPSTSRASRRRRGGARSTDRVRLRIRLVRRGGRDRAGPPRLEEASGERPLAGRLRSRGGDRLSRWFSLHVFAFGLAALLAVVILDVATKSETRRRAVLTRLGAALVLAVLLLAPLARHMLEVRRGIRLPSGRSGEPPLFRCSARLADDDERQSRAGLPEMAKRLREKPLSRDRRDPSSAPPESPASSIRRRTPGSSSREPSSPASVSWARSARRDPSFPS